MAKNEIVWGIDVGNTSLKALRCRLGSEPGTLEVLGFDFIEHSKVMSQPGADPAEIMAESLALFLSRNDIKGEKIAVAVSGQSALWRFQPLPPVDPRKIKDLVKYEVRQWLPFNLDDVIWTFRQVGGFREGNILLDANIFMYAMKKELTNKIVRNYGDNGIDIDVIQGAPIALYNSYVHNFYTPEELEERDPAQLNDFDIILNVGTDTTEVVITNGVTIWLRNIPIGGNLFTKSLTKSLKLTFSNAEHIKRNAASSQDPKAVILAMKPVFTEMQSEIDRSIKYYCSLNKSAKIRRIYALGNAMKLPGLRQFLAKSHGLEVIVPNSFDKLRGPEVLANPQFKENLSSFAVSYGLALQLLHRGTLDVNLIPPEVVRDRLINGKKPWTLAAAALLLLAFAIQYIGSTAALGTVKNDAIASAASDAKRVHDQSTKLQSDVKSEVTDFKKMDVIGKTLTSNVEGRLTWVELIKAVNAFLNIPKDFFPTDESSLDSLPPEFSSMTSREKAAAISKQDRVYIQNIEVVPVDDLANWFEQVRPWYSIDDTESQWFKAADEGDTSILDTMYAFPEAPQFGISTLASTAKSSGGKGSSKRSGKSSGASRSATSGAKKAAGGAKSGKTASKGSAKGSAKGSKAGAKGGAAVEEAYVENKDERIDMIPGPSGEGKVVQLLAYHYHNPSDENDSNRGAEYVRRRLLRWMKHGYVNLPASLERQRSDNTAKKEMGPITFKEFGIFYPVMVNPGPVDDNYLVLDPDAASQEFNKLKESSLKGRSGTTGGARPGMAGGMGPGMAGGMGMGPGMAGGMGMGPGMAGGMGMGPGMGMMGGGIGSMPGIGTVAKNMSQNNSEKVLKLRRFDFVIQFVWQETPPSIREERIAEAVAAAEEAAQKDAQGKSGKGQGTSSKTTKKSNANAADVAATDANTAANETTPAAPAGENGNANSTNPVATTENDAPTADTATASDTGTPAPDGTGGEESPPTETAPDAPPEPTPDAAPAAPEESTGREETVR